MQLFLVMMTLSLLPATYRSGIGYDEIAGSPTSAANNGNRESAAAQPAAYLPRIGIKPGESRASFVVKDTGRPFFVRGFNYIRLRNSHATFEAATDNTESFYDPDRTEKMFQTLQQHGYNTVRVFVCGRHPKDPGISGDFKTTKGLYTPYMENFVDFLQRARRHSVYVMPTFGDGELPLNKSYQEAIRSLPRSKNVIYFTRDGMDAKKRYLSEFLQFIVQRDPRLATTLLALQCQNELYVRGDQWPFDQREGEFTSVDGRQYDLSNDTQRRALMNDGLRLYHQEVIDALKAIDSEILVTEGLFVLRAVGKTLETHEGVVPGTSPDPRFPPTVLSLGKGPLDFLDVHFYRTRPTETTAEAIARDMSSTKMDSPEIATVWKTKPIIVGEFGAFRFVDPDFQTASKNLLSMRDEFVRRKFNGFLFWTYDTLEQKRLYHAIMGGDDFLRELNRFRPPVVQ